ncbi:MAG: hypothetical protein JXR96_19555 [Deltaproteobacteria bacterium]|nr:hypothetical protein [Deltaproteobacteria bacterium]
MKRLTIMAVTLCALAGEVRAEKPLELPSIHAGLGMSYGVDFGFDVPVLLFEEFKLEPGFGLRHLNSAMDVRFNLGLFYTPKFGRLFLNLGLRSGIEYYDADGTSGMLSYLFGPAFGVEYFLCTHFSIGGEVQLLVTLYDYRDEDDSSYEIATGARVFVRFYFTGLSDLLQPDAEKQQVIESKGIDAAEVQRKPEVPPKSEETPVTQPKRQVTPELPPEPEPEPEPVLPEVPPEPELPEPELPVLPRVCLPGSEVQGDAPPRGWEQYCASRDVRGQLVKNGWYRSWYESGELASVGEYRDGQRDGVWIFFHSNGRRRLEAEYVAGKKRGSWIFRDREGRVLRRESFGDEKE